MTCIVMITPVARVRRQGTIRTGRVRPTRGVFFWFGRRCTRGSPGTSMHTSLGVTKTIEGAPVTRICVGTVKTVTNLSTRTGQGCIVLIHQGYGR